MSIDIVGPDLAMAIQCVIISICGLIGNGTLLTVIIQNKELRREHYIIFILNRAVNEFIFNVLLGTLNAAAILVSSPTSSLCAAAGFVDISFESTSIYTEPLLACDRYISIFHMTLYESIYTMRNMSIMCVMTWILGILSAVPHVFAGSLGRVRGSICTIRFAPDTLAVTVGVNYLLALIGLALILFFNLKMYRYLKRYQNIPMTNSQKTKLQTDREILRFIFVAAFLPMFFQAPLIIIEWIEMVAPVSAWLIYSGMSLFTVSLLVNPAIALFLIKPIRKEFLIVFRKLIGHSSAVAAIQ